MRNSLLLVLLLLSIFSNAQNSPKKFGDLSVEDLKMSRYEKDTSASAVILFDVGETFLSEDLVVSFDRHIRIKFFTLEDADQWATKTIYLSHMDDSFSKLKAATYNLEDGEIKVTKISDDAIFKTKVDRYTDQIKFTLPNVKKGSIIEFRYNLRTSASLLPGWQFQNTIPTILTDYEVTIPRSFTFNHDIQGLLRIDEHRNNGDGSNERWTLHHVPAFKVEDLMPNRDDYISKINFRLTELFIPGRPIIKFNRSWWRVVDDLEKNPDFGLQIKGSNFLKKTVEEITKDKSDDLDKAIAIVNYIKEHVTWNEVIDKIPDRSFKRMLEEKSGSSSEINMLLVSMLLKANLNAYPLLISTRDHGRVRQTYLFSEFNDVICLVKLGDKTLLLDCTDKELSYQALPARCLNGSGLVVSSETLEWVPTNSIKSRTLVNTEITLSESETLSGKMKVQYEGLESSHSRKQFTELGKEKYFTDRYSNNRWGVASGEVELISDATKNVREVLNIEGNRDDFFQVSDSLIFFNPYLINQIQENKFKSEERKYPVDFETTFENTYMLKIALPENYGIETLPESKVVLLPDNGGKFVYSVSRIPNGISMTSQLIIGKRFFSVKEYPLLKEFYNLIISKQNELLVLRKSWQLKK